MEVFYYAEKQLQDLLECEDSCLHGSSRIMHLVLTRVLVVELGAYRISVGKCLYDFGRSLDGPGSRSRLRFYGGHPGSAS